MICAWATRVSRGNLVDVEKKGSRFPRQGFGFLNQAGPSWDDLGPTLGATLQANSAQIIFLLRQKQHFDTTSVLHRKIQANRHKSVPGT